MVQVIDLPTQPTAMGLADLGQAFQNAAQGYVAQNDEDKKRAQQLADIQSARDYASQEKASDRSFESTEFDRRQKAQQDAESLHEKGQLREKLAMALSQNGYLDPDKVNDQTAIERAYAAAKRDGLIDKYKDLINHGYLQIADIDDPQKVADAQQKAAGAATTAFAASADQKSNAAAAASALSSQHEKTLANLQAAEEAAETDPASAQPSPQDVQNLAAQMARQASGGKPVTAQMVQDNMQAASQQLREQAMVAAQQRVQQAKVILPSLQRQAASEDDRLNQFEKLGVFANPESDAGTSAPAPAATLTPANTPPPGGAQQAAFAALTGKGPAPIANQPTGAVPAPEPLANAKPTPPPTFNYDQNPVQAAAHQAAQDTAMQRNLAPTPVETPAQQAVGQIAEIEGQLRAALANPGANAALITSLQAKRQALLQQLQAMRQKAPPGTMGTPPTASETAAPAFSNASGSAPTPPPAATWWQSADSVASPVPAPTSY